MAALVENSRLLKREIPDEIPWEPYNFEDFQANWHMNIPHIHPYRVQQPRHTTPDDAGIRPTKRFCSEALQSSRNAPNPPISPASSADPSISLHGYTVPYTLTCVLGTGTQAAEHGGEPDRGSSLWSLVTQANWTPTPQIQSPDNICNTVTSFPERIAQPCLDIPASVSHPHPHTHVIAHNIYPFPVPGHEVSSQSSDPWPSRHVSFIDSRDSSILSSFEPAASAPLVSPSLISQSTYAPMSFAELPHSPSHPRHSYRTPLYEPSQDTDLGGAVSQSKLEATRTLESFTVAPAFSHNLENASYSFSPQENPVGHGIRTMSLDSVTGLSGEQEPGWVMVTTYSAEMDAVHPNPSEQLGYDEPELVPIETPLSSSFEDLGSSAQALYHSAMCIPIVSAQGNRLRCTEVKERKKRGQFSEEDRQATSVTRGVGACMRCRAQRIRCSPSDPNDPAGPCGPCAKVSKTNKKTIHRIPCFRFKFTTMTLHRSGGLNYTKRFTHMEVVDVGDHADHEILTVKMTQGLCKVPVILRVRRFQKREGDVIDRWYTENGTPKKQSLQPYCLADIEKTAKEFRKYIDDNALDGLEEAVKDSDDLVKMTFRMIAKECRAANDSGRSKSKKTQKQIEEQLELRKFLCMVVRLWFAIRHETGSAWLCGPETLGSEISVPGEKPAVPRMIVAQFDSIRHERIYKDLEPRVLKAIESYICSCNMNAWFGVYLASFLLLHQISCSSHDRKRWADAYTSQTTPAGDKTRYGPRDHPLTSLVEYIQEGGRSLLLHWQYFKRCDLMNADWENPRKSSLKYLKPYQLKFMRATVEMFKKKEGGIPTTPSEGCWEHELFWISHLFGSPPSNDKNWTPPDGFSRAKPSVGNP